MNQSSTPSGPLLWSPHCVANYACQFNAENSKQSRDPIDSGLIQPPVQCWRDRWPGLIALEQSASLSQFAAFHLMVCRFRQKLAAFPAPFARQAMAGAAGQGAQRRCKLIDALALRPQWTCGLQNTKGLGMSMPMGHRRSMTAPLPFFSPVRVFRCPERATHSGIRMCAQPIDHEVFQLEGMATTLAFGASRQCPRSQMFFRG